MKEDKIKRLAVKEDQFRRIRLIKKLMSFVNVHFGEIVTTNRRLRHPHTILVINKHDDQINTKHINELEFVLDNFYYAIKFSNDTRVKNYFTKTPVIGKNKIEETNPTGSLLSDIYVKMSTAECEPTDDEMRQLAFQLFQEITEAENTPLLIRNKKEPIQDKDGKIHFETVQTVNKIKFYYETEG